MRIAYICADPGIPVFGTKGASVHVQEVLRVLLEAGHCVELFCRRTDGGPWPALAEAVSQSRLRVHELGRIRGESPADREQKALEADTELRRLLEHSGPFDAVYERYSLWSSAGTAHAAERAIPSVLEVNAPLPQEQARHRTLVNAEIADDIITRAARRASAVVCVSEPVAAWVRGRLDGAAGHVVVEANGVDTERIRPAAGSDRPAGPFTVGFVGTLKPWHGTEVLMEAHALLRETMPQARLLLVGDGPQADSLRRQAADLGIEAAVEMTGAVAPAQICSLLQRMDVGVAPYPAGGEGYFSPLKVYEYMAAGLPVVASAVGQLPEVIDDSRTGLLVPGSDPVALAAALTRVAADAKLSHRLGYAAREHVLGRRTWRHIVERSLAAANIRLGEGVETSDPADTRPT